ncbi:DMT family transporter [Nocardia sp. NPDC127579]|uniref:EamA family transporter n=1 Tax=Nocardia sp. NPDC127579 TaxID=3345402 RepID=UPI00362A9687
MRWVVTRAQVGVWLTVASGLAFASSGSFAKSVLGAGWSPGAVLAIRLSGAAVVLLVLAAWRDPAGLRDSVRHARAIVAFGVIAIAGVQATFFLSLEYLQVGVSLMIQFLAPIAVIGWNWAVRGQRPTVATALGALLAIGGAALVINVFDAGGLSLPGLGWAGLSMVCNAALFLLSERATARVRPTVLLGTGLTVAAATSWILAVTQVLPLRTGAGTVTLAEHRIPAALSLVLLILISTVVAYVCGVAGAARIGSTLMSLILLSEVMFAVALSWLLLGEAVAPIQLVGSVVVIGGIVLAQQRRMPELDPPGRTDAVDAPALPRI